MERYLGILTGLGAVAAAERIREDKVDKEAVLKWLANQAQDNMDQLLQLYDILKVEVTEPALLAYHDARMIAVNAAVEAAWGKGWRGEFDYDDVSCGYKKMLAIKNVTEQYPKLEHAIAAVSMARTCRFDRVTNGEKGERKPTQKFTTADFEEACQSRKRKHIGDKESPEPTRATAESELSPAGASTRTTRSANAIIPSDNGDPHEEFGSNDSCRARTTTTTTAPVHDGNETDNWIPKALDFVSKKGSSIPSIENHTLITLPITYRELEEESKKDSPKMNVRMDTSHSQTPSSQDQRHHPDV